MKKTKYPKFIYWIDVNNEDHPPSIILYSVDKVTHDKNPDGSPITLYHNNTYKTVMNSEYCHETLQKAYFYFALIEDKLKETYKERTIDDGVYE